MCRNLPWQYSRVPAAACEFACCTVISDLVALTSIQPQAIWIGVHHG